jgi:hypothetical protein
MMKVRLLCVLASAGNNEEKRKRERRKDGKKREKFVDVCVCVLDNE